MKRVVINLPDPNDACSFYRGLGPWSRICRQNREIDVRLTNTPTTSDFLWADVMFCQRPCTPHQLETIRSARSHGVQIWLDYDDDLSELRPDNQNFPFYNTPAIRTAMSLILLEADVVTGSTETLAAALRSRGAKSVVAIPNAFNRIVETWLDKPMKPPQKPVVMWRGTNTHQMDLLFYKDEIRDLFESYEDVLFAFLGSVPWTLGELSKNCVVFPQTSTIKDYFKMASVLRPDVMMVPLMPGHFNYCKSNIAALEAASFGAVSVVPNWDEWRLPGVLSYDNHEEFIVAITTAIHQASVDKPKNYSYVRELQAHMETVLDLDEVNKKRLSVLWDL